MNRAERRRKQKSEKNIFNKKQIDFMSKFTPEVRREIDKAIDEVADRKFQEKTEELFFYVDNCITAAAIINTDLSLEQIEKIQKNSVDLLDENTKKINAFKKEYGGDWLMKFNDYEGPVREFCQELIRKGYKQKEAIIELVNKFDKMPKAALVNAFKRCKEEIKAAEELKEKVRIENAVDYIFGEEEKVEAPEVIKEKNKEVSEEKEMKEINGKIVAEEIKVEINVNTVIMQKLNKFTDEKDKITLKINNLENEINVLKIQKDGIETKEDKVRQALELLKDIDL